MSYAARLTNLASASERSLGRLVDEQEAENARTKTLDALETRWSDAASDGVVDGRELRELIELSKAAGTDDLTRHLESLGSGTGPLEEDALLEAEELLRKSLRGAHLENGQGSTARQLLLQLGMSEMKTLYESASAASRTEHQAYMTAIGNLKA